MLPSSRRIIQPFHGYRGLSRGTAVSESSPQHGHGAHPDGLTAAPPTNGGNSSAERSKTFASCPSRLAETPGVAIVAGQDGQWYRARSFYVSEEAAERAAHTHADLTPSWAQITAAHLSPVPDDHRPALQSA